MGQLLSSLDTGAYLRTGSGESNFLLQGIICFESIQQEALQQGLCAATGPVICKPNELVRVFHLPQAVVLV